jgi:hypothetical protein
MRRANMHAVTWCIFSLVLPEVVLTYTEDGTTATAGRHARKRERFVSQSGA